MKTFGVKPKLLKKSLEEEKENQKVKKETKEEIDVFSIDDSLQMEIGSTYFEKKLEKVSKKIKSDPNYLKRTKFVIRKPKIITNIEETSPNISQDSQNSQILKQIPKNEKTSPIQIKEKPEIQKKKAKNVQKRKKSEEEETSNTQIEQDFDIQKEIDSVFNLDTSEKELDYPNEESSDGIASLVKKVKQKKKRKLKPLIKTSNELKLIGKEQNQRDNIYYCLDGFADNQSLDVKCSSLNDFLGFMKDPEFKLFLRAHGMMKLVIDSLLKITKYQVKLLN